MSIMPGVARTAGQSGGHRPIWTVVLALLVALVCAIGFASQTHAQTPLTFTKSFTNDPVGIGGTVTLQYTITNNSPTSAVSSLVFQDDISAILPGLRSITAAQSGICGARSTGTGTDIFEMVSGTLAPGASCIFSITLQIPASAAAGAYPSTSGGLLGRIRTRGGIVIVTAPGATDTLTIASPPAPAFDKTFSPDTIAEGGVSRLTFAIDNSGSTADATSLDFTDNFPAGVEIASPANVSNTCTGGTVTALSGTAVASYTGGTVATGATCTLQVDVTAAAAGPYANTSGDLTSSLGNSGTASDTLQVNGPPGFSKEFSPDGIPEGGVSTLTFTIDNTANAVEANTLEFSDDLPRRVRIASPITTTCTGGNGVNAGNTTIAFRGGTVAAGATCTVQVDVSASRAGTFVNISDDLTSSLGNSGTATATLNVNGAPTVVISGVPGQTDGVTPFTATITFDEAVTGFGDPGDVTATNAAVGAITAVSATVYTVDITPNGGGDVTVGVPAGVAVDTNGLPNEAATPVVSKLDAIPPTVEILGAPASIAGTDAFTVTIQFSEIVTGFAAGDITIGNGSVTGFTVVDGDTYSATITPSGGGDITIDVAAGVANDTSGTPNEAAKQVVVKSTVVEDTVKIVGAFLGARSRIITQNQPDSKRRLDRLNGTTSNNGSISGFGMSLTSGKIPFAATIGEDSASFSYSLRASRAKAGEDKVNANVESILGQNGIQRSPTIDPDESVADRMQREAEERFNARHARVPANDNRIIASQEYSYAAARVDTAHAGEQFPRPPGPADFVSIEDRFDIWAEGTYGRYDGFGGTGSFAVVHMGMDYLVTPDLLIGLGGQLDWLTYDNAVQGNADGFGFMVGPYATVRLTERFYGDARIAWGTSSNSASPYDTYSDDFDTQRWLATAAIFGDFDYGGVLVRPEVRMTWFTEESDSYLDSLGNTIPSVKVESGTLEFGPTLSKAMLLDSGVTFTPSFTAKGIWTFASQNSADAITTLPEGLTEEGIRALVEGSLDFAGANGYRFGITGSYDGIGDDNYEAWSLKGRLAISW